MGPEDAYGLGCYLLLAPLHVGSREEQDSVCCYPFLPLSDFPGPGSQVPPSIITVLLFLPEAFHFLLCRSDVGIGTGRIENSSLVFSNIFSISYGAHDALASLVPPASHFLYAMHSHDFFPFALISPDLKCL